MKKIITFGGSSSENSINTQLVNYVSNQLNNYIVKDINMSTYLTLPLFSVDYIKENETPNLIVDLFKLFHTADGFIISLAEHNGSYPATYKNVIDWLSVQNEKMFNNKPVLLMATSPGKRGGSSVLEQDVNYYPHMGAKITGSFSLPLFNDNFKNSEIINNDLKTKCFNELKKFEKLV